VTILCDRDLRTLLRDGLIEEPDFDLVNPASIDVRIGSSLLLEESYGRYVPFALGEQLSIAPGDFFLTETLEKFNVPNGYAVELRMKSTTARRGWDHALAVWIDPGFRGVITLEIKNTTQFHSLLIQKGMRFAQAIVHKLSGESDNPYAGKYQDATGLEGPK
jgi:dCTP deaminase